MDTTRHAPKAWRILLLALGTAIVGSVWSLYAGSNCASCHSTELLFPRNVLASTGVAYYTVLFVAAVMVGPTIFVYSGVLVAAGVHAGLVATLIHLRTFCLPCVLTATAAAVALAAVIACDRSNIFRASLVSPGAALAVQMWVVLSGALPAAAASRDEAARVVHEEFAQPPVPSGTVRMVAYTRPDCGYCVELERDVLPGLARDYGNRLVVERRSAEELPGIPTPTLILTGASKRRLFPGLPSTQDLRNTIDTLMGEPHGLQTMLEKSR